jgi:type II restriction/modification system DNA methylase subunit YeeA
MNTSQLKKFAQDARKKLLEQVGAKLSFVLTTDSSELREKAAQVNQLREELNRTTKEQLIEKVAYTWFNRLMALRFMDSNDYQPLGIRVITPKDGYTTPELLDEAKRGNIPDELKLKRQRVFDLLDNRIPSTNPQNEAYKELLIAACNHLNTVFPFLFEKISDYTELLMPDDLTSDFSIVTDVREGMPIADCAKVEIIGWLYQFYISEKKDEVFASKSAVKKEDIPAATQLFTPRWIVEYMVQNTVGKLWLQNRPKSKLREYMPYFIESATMKSEDFLKVSSPEEIKLLDPASGSGHILVYAFDLFTKIYEEEGYSTNDIPKLIIEKNLHGFEIDERAAQLSGLALMMKAREYNRRAFKKDLQPNIICFQDLQLNNNEIKQTLSALQIKVSDELIHDLINMQQATNFGSLILPLANLTEMIKFSERLNQIKSSGDLFQKNAIDALQIAINHLIRLTGKFHCIAANPPYMGAGKMNTEISDWVRINYPVSKADLFSCFIERSIELVPDLGFIGLVTMESWMFLSSFENLRIKLLHDNLIDSLIHMPYLGKGGTSMGINFGTASYVLIKNREIKCDGQYQCIRYFETNEYGIPFNFPTKNEKFSNVNQENFQKILGSPIAYWASNATIKIFENASSLEDEGLVRQGASTSNNERFLRFWFEVNFSSIGFNLNNTEDAKEIGCKWFPYNKGGEFRKWWGNQEYVINYGEDGKDLKQFQSNLNQGWTARLKSREYYFKETISWTKISSGKFSVRYYPSGFIFDVAGCCYFPYSKDDFFKILGFLNTKITSSMLEFFSPTLNFEIEQIKKLPKYGFEKIELNKIDQCINYSKLADKSIELSTCYLRNNFFENIGEDLIETYDLYQQYWKNKFYQLHKNEEELNRQFIEIYGLQEELTPDVPMEDITILKEETVIENNQLVFNADEVFSQFMSYAVGCMFGRYSLDKEGLVLANQGETLQDYLHKIEKTTCECTFLPDDDNIIPVLDNEWFEDDITGRFYQFLKVTFGEKNFGKNLAFVEEQLGKDIRKYFTKDFYADHIKRYKKRPIYWMFSSSKGSFNVLIYLHRYTPDTVSNILNKYLKEFIGKLKTRNVHLQHIQVHGSPAEKTKAIKESDSIEKILIELHEYERDILFPLATDRIVLDLDDGVLVNYNKFGKAVKEVSGLNDAATKKKVREFDWIDATQIR